MYCGGGCRLRPRAACDPMHAVHPIQVDLSGSLTLTSQNLGRCIHDHKPRSAFLNALSLHFGESCWSMRSWESEHGPTTSGWQTDSQDRIDHEAAWQHRVNENLTIRGHPSAIGGKASDRWKFGNAWCMPMPPLDEQRRAIEHHEQHLEIARQIGDRRGEGNVRVLTAQTRGKNTASARRPSIGFGRRWRSRKRSKTRPSIKPAPSSPNGPRRRMPAEAASRADPKHAARPIQCRLSGSPIPTPQNLDRCTHGSQAAFSLP